jgi:hypothetical protein
MTTQLSSRWTPLFKFVIPVIAAAVWGSVTTLLFIDPGRVSWNGGGVAPEWAKWAFLAFLIVLGFMCGRLARLKTVVLTDDALFVSNYARSVRIPLRVVYAGGFEPDAYVEVGASVGPIGLRDRRPLVGLEFQRQTAFGRFIEFIPKSEEALAVLRARLGWSEPEPPPRQEEKSELAEELHGRGTV